MEPTTETPPVPPAKPPKPPIPWWAWLFAAACALIPIITLGGAIPAAIGGAGVFGCIGAAREAKLSRGARLAICIGITVGCWVLFVVLLVVVALFASRPPRP